MLNAELHKKIFNQHSVLKSLEMWTRPRTSTISEVKQCGLIKGHWVMLKKWFVLLTHGGVLDTFPGSPLSMLLRYRSTALLVQSALCTRWASPARLYVTSLLKVQRKEH